jgi:hypothetical protein
MNNMGRDRKSHTVFNNCFGLSWITRQEASEMDWTPYTVRTWGKTLVWRARSEAVRSKQTIILTWFFNDSFIDTQEQLSVIVSELEGLVKLSNNPGLNFWRLFQCKKLFAQNEHYT